jgi:hypothetical protein
MVKGNGGTAGYGGVNYRPGCRLAVKAKELKGIPSVPVNRQQLQRRQYP